MDWSSQVGLPGEGVTLSFKGDKGQCYESGESGLGSVKLCLNTDSAVIPPCREEWWTVLFSLGKFCWGEGAIHFCSLQEVRSKNRSLHMDCFVSSFSLPNIYYVDFSKSVHFKIY